MDMKKTVLPAVGVTVVAGAAVLMMKPRKRHHVQRAAGRAIKAVGEAVENFSGFKM